MNRNPSWSSRRSRRAGGCSCCWACWGSGVTPDTVSRVVRNSVVLATRAQLLPVLEYGEHQEDDQDQQVTTQEHDGPDDGLGHWAPPPLETSGMGPVPTLRARNRFRASMTNSSTPHCSTMVPRLNSANGSHHSGTSATLCRIHQPKSTTNMTGNA